MVPNKTDIIALHKKYARNDELFNRFFTHCKIVAHIAEWYAVNSEVDVNKEILVAAALLHDIGSYVLCDENGKIDTKYYQLHGLLGASILEDEGVDQRICDIVHTHQFTINTVETVRYIESRSPRINREPQTLEAQLVSYADRFHSKKPIFNSEDYLMQFLDKLPEKKQKFETYKMKFGLPDIENLAKQYNHPIQ